MIYHSDDLCRIDLGIGKSHCKTFEDVAKFLHISYKDFILDTLPKFIKYDILRITEVGEIKFIMLNPLMSRHQSLTYDIYKISTWADILDKEYILSKWEMAELLGKDINFIENLILKINKNKVDLLSKI